MIKQVIQSFFDKNKSIQDEEIYAVAVSGGPDSMALAHALLTTYSDKDIHILSIDHDLRPDSSVEIDAVEEWVKAYPNSIFKRFIWEGAKPETAIMEAARAARYDLMADYCVSQNIQHLFLGHHQDDQAETFLIRLAKGSGLDGLGAMASISSYQNQICFVRPLLDVTKEDILRYCKINDIQFSEDPSNENGEYLRPRLREAKTILEKEGLTSKRLSITARRLARARDALQNLSHEAYGEVIEVSDDDMLFLDAQCLAKWPEDIRLRVLKRALETLQPVENYSVRYDRLEDLHEAIWTSYDQDENMKRRSLGHCFFSYDNVKKIIEIEKGKK